jgi:hypothetical protein
VSSSDDAALAHERRRRRTGSAESAAVAGIVYAVVATAALALLSRIPHPSLSDESVSAWYEDTGHRSGLILGLNFAAISSVAFLWFVAVIRRRIGDLEDRFFATVFFGSAIVYVGIWLVAASLLAAPAVALTMLEAGAVDQATSTFASGFAGALMLVAAPRIQAVFVLTTSTLILRTKVLPNWLAYFGYLVGIGLFTVPIVSRPVGIGLPIWVLIVSVTVLLSRAKSAEAAPNT